MRKVKIRNLSRVIILLVVFALVFGSCAILIPPVSSQVGALGITETGIDSALPSWVNLNPPNPPEPRVGHTMFDLPGHGLAVLFGGSSSATVFADTWEFHYDTNTWTNLNALNSPPPLTGQGMVYDPDLDKVILFGGASDALTPTSMQTWSYNYASNSWTALNTSNPPPPRAVPGMAYDPVHYKMILFGGRSGFPPAGDSMGDCWSYDPASNTWTNLNPASAPTAREAMGMVWVPGWNRVLLFGSHNGGVPGFSLTKPGPTTRIPTYGAI
jgi:N-acetylneuraminic acid mutarotase